MKRFVPLMIAGFVLLGAFTLLVRGQEIIGTPMYTSSTSSTTGHAVVFSDTTGQLVGDAGLLPNSALVSSSTSVNGQTCALGTTCTTDSIMSSSPGPASTFSVGTYHFLVNGGGANSVAGSDWGLIYPKPLSITGYSAFTTVAPGTTSVVVITLTDSTHSFPNVPTCTIGSGSTSCTATVTGGFPLTTSANDVLVYDMNVTVASSASGHYGVALTYHTTP